MPSSKPTKPKRLPGIQSVSIAARFLRVLAQSEGPLMLGEIAKRAQAGASTTHRYLQSLVEEGLAMQHEISGRYDLGRAALSLGTAALRRIDAVEIASRHMKALADRRAASCGVAVWTDRGPTLVRWFRSAYFTISTVHLGDVLPLDNSASGLVFQSWLPKERAGAVRRTQPAQLRGSKVPTDATLADIRAAGGAALHEHLFASLSGMAAPVFDANNDIVCVVTTVSMVEARAFDAFRQELFDIAAQASLEAGAQARPK